MFSPYGGTAPPESRIGLQVSREIDEAISKREEKEVKRMTDLLDYQDLPTEQINEAEVAWSLFSIFC